MFRRASRNGAVGSAGPDALAVEARGLGKVYRSGAAPVEALRGIDLRIERGELVAIAGPSGCGKTTLLNSVSGLDSIDAGTVHIAGTDINKLSDNAKTTYRARNMGFIFQFYNLLPVLSAVENVELPLVVSGISGKEARKRAVAALERVGLRNWESHRPAQLSGGQRQRVTIARALVNNPAIVWADEPTGNLDSDSAAEVMALIRRLNAERGRTFVIVTHAADVAGHASRIVRMRDGRVVADEGRTWSVERGASDVESSPAIARPTNSGPSPTLHAPRSTLD